MPQALTINKKPESGRTRASRVRFPLSTKQTLPIVDDETSIVRLCAAILEEAGFSLLPVTIRAETLKLVKHHPGSPHLLLKELVLHPPDFSVACGDNQFRHPHDPLEGSVLRAPLELWPHLVWKEIDERTLIIRMGGRVAEVFQWNGWKVTRMNVSHWVAR